jgi:uncharacterized protein involved in tolerance to divalent cations
MRSKENLFEEIIQSIYDYEVCEISYYKIKRAKKFLDWIKKETI